MIERSKLTLYAVTDGEKLADIERAIAGGVTCVQLRIKHKTAGYIAEKAKQTLKICRAAGVPLIIDDDYKTALAVGADGVHVGRSDCPVAEVRRAAGADFIIGATAKTAGAAREAELAGADYIGTGAMFASVTKPEAVITPIDRLCEICRSVKIPVVAIGGITPENALSLLGAPVAGIAVSSGIFAAQNVENAAKQLKIYALEIAEANI